MHAVATTVSCGVLVTAACAAPATLGWSAPWLLALLVAFIGLPHGAADHRFARPLLEPRLGIAWYPAFLGGYGLTAVAVLAGWLVFPALTITLFFVASAWHFGAEEPSLTGVRRSVRPLLQTSRGGLVIWTTVLFRKEQVTEALTITSPTAAASAVGAAVAVIAVISVVMLSVATLAWVLQCVAAVTSGGRKRRVLAMDCVMVASLVALFALTSPLVGFGVYFCGWHSARGLRGLRRQLGESRTQLARSLAPMTLVALLLIGLGACCFPRMPSVSDVLLQATFLGLSAVATPHLLLHGVAPRLALNAPETGPPAVLAGGAA